MTMKLLMMLSLWLWAPTISCTLSLSRPQVFVSAFSSLPRSVSSTRRDTFVPSRTTVDDTSTADTITTDDALPILLDDDDGRSSSCWATYALLFSSLSDGILPNDDAKSFLRYSLVNSLLREHIVHKEGLLESSVKFSPCNGPNTDTLRKMERFDLLLERGRELFPSDVTAASYDNESIDAWSDETLGQLQSDRMNELHLRVLYIPTAMYALNPQSTNTPGKQRQRARADGKQRRDQLLNLLKDLFPQQVNLLAVTLDLDDGSLKQPYGSENKSLFPENDIASFSTWHPHLIYVEGGNTFWLQHCIDKGGYAKLIKGACTGNGSAVYCGKSAGAIVAGKCVATATWKEWDDPSIVPEKQIYSDWLQCQGMEFVGQHSFFPHMSDAWSETVRERVERHNLVGSNSVYCLHEQDACCVMGERKLAFLTLGPEAFTSS